MQACIPYPVIGFQCFKHLNSETRQHSNEVRQIRFFTQWNVRTWKHATRTLTSKETCNLASSNVRQEGSHAWPSGPLARLSSTAPPPLGRRSTTTTTVHNHHHPCGTRAPSTLPASLLPSLKHCMDASWPGFTDRSNAHKTAPRPGQHTMHEHTTKAVATFGTEAPLIKAW